MDYDGRLGYSRRVKGRSTQGPAMQYGYRGRKVARVIRQGARAALDAGDECAWGGDDEMEDEPWAGGDDSDEDDDGEDDGGGSYGGGDGGKEEGEVAGGGQSEEREEGELSQ